MYICPTLLKQLYLPNKWLHSIMYTNINHLSLNSIHIIMISLATHDWFYKVFKSVTNICKKIDIICYFKLLVT